MKYLVKRTNETDDLSFEASWEEIQAGFTSGQILPDWTARKQTDGSAEWITVKQLCATTAPETSPAQSSTMGPAVSFALAAVALILAIYWLTMPTQGAGKWSTEHLIGMTVTKFESERSSTTPRIIAVVCAGAWLGWSVVLIAKAHRRQRTHASLLLFLATLFFSGCGDPGPSNRAATTSQQPLATSTNWEVRFLGQYPAVIETAFDPTKAPKRQPSFKTPAGAERFSYFVINKSAFERDSEPFDIWYEFSIGDAPSGPAPGGPTYVRVLTNAPGSLAALVFEGVARTARGGFKDGTEDVGFPFKPSIVEVHASGGAKLKHRLLAIGSDLNWIDKVFRAVPERARGVYTPATQGERFFWLILFATNAIAGVNDLTVSNLFEEASLHVDLLGPSHGKASSTLPPRPADRAIAPAPPLAEDEVERVMAAAYAKLPDAWQPHERQFNKEAQVPLVTKLLNNEADTRWAKILIDSRVLGKDREFSFTVGAVMALTRGGPPFEPYPITEEFGLPKPNEEGTKWLVNQGVNIDDIKRLYGAPQKVSDWKGYKVHYYGFVGFRTSVDNPMIEGLHMPFCFFKLGHSPFAELVSQRPAGKK
jgi:hypothetical protein